MYKDFVECPHCTIAGKVGSIIRLNATTPTISRSDGKDYHLILFSGPEGWQVGETKIHGRSEATYRYASNQLNLSDELLTVVFRTIDLDRNAIVTAMADAADQIAAVLSEGRQPARELYYDRGAMQPLSPSDRPYASE